MSKSISSLFCENNLVETRFKFAKKLNLSEKYLFKIEN